MGLFNWFTAKREPVFVWLTRQAKLSGIGRCVAEALADAKGPAAIFVTAHFQDTLNELVEGIDVEQCEGRVLLTKADALGAFSASQVAFDHTQPVLIIVAERHPLSVHDKAVSQFGSNLSSECQIVYHLSLEDPLMRPFAGEWVENVLRSLGMTEDQAIQSRMVERRLERALRRIEAEATGDQPADSAEEWLERNCPRQWKAQQR